MKKQLGGKKAKIGVRVAADQLLAGIIGVARRPLLVSSANREKKGGDTSPAQVRKNFAGVVQLFFDQGDLPAEPASTVIDVVNGEIVIERAGAIDPAELHRLAAGEP